MDTRLPFLRAAGLLCLLITCLAMPAAAQVDRATLAGTVTDASEAVVPGATVEITAVDTGMRRQTKTGASGNYTFTFLPIGNYTVIATMEGFETKTMKDVRLGVGENRNLDIQLQVSGAAVAIQVEAQATPLEREAANIGSVIGNQQVSEMPLNGRHWVSLMQLAPGAINTGAGDMSSIRFMGRARDDNMTTFDGVDTTAVKDPRQDSNLRLIVSTDAIAEFRVNSGLYSAESGSGQGAQVNIVSKTGTNEFHGSVFEMFRNDKLDARGFFDEYKPPFRLNQFGGNLGGPIIKNRTFFFANYEALRQRKGQTLAGTLVPSAALRARIIATSPALKPVVDAYPVGFAPTANKDIDSRIEQTRRSWTENSAMIRVDHRITDRNLLFGRFSTDDGTMVNPAEPPPYLATSYIRPSNGMLAYQRVFTPNIINEWKAGVNRAATTGNRIGHFPIGVSVPGLMSLTGPNLTAELGTSYSLIDNLAVTKGRHTIKAGMEVRRMHINSADNYLATQSISFASLNDFIANKADSMSVNSGQPVHGARRTFYMPFVQDDIKVRPNLTLNLGLRYEYYTVMHEVNGLERVVFFECGGLCPKGTAWWYPDRNNFDPRLGLTWSPRALKDRTVFRLGFGAYHGPGQNDDLNSPIDSDVDKYALTGSDVAGGLSYPIDRFLSQAKLQGMSPRMNQRDRRDMYNLQYGLSIQHQIKGNFVADVGYAGNQGHKVFYRRYVNNYLDPISKIRPLPQFSRFDVRENLSNTNFNSLHLSLQRRFSGGFLWGTQYLWSHAINEGAMGGGESGRPENNLCRTCEKGNSPEDIRHTITSNWVYELPFKRTGAAGKLLNGWQISGIWNMRTGRMLTPSITRSSGDMYDGNTGDQRPDLVGPIVINQGNPNCYIQNPANPLCGSSAPSPFAVPAKYKWGNAGRSIATGPGMIQVDFSVHKKTAIGEKQSLDFRAEAFNIFNRANFGNPGMNISSPLMLGRITGILNSNIGTGTSRQVQFVMRYVF